MLEFLFLSITVGLVWVFSRHSRPLPPSYTDKYKDQSQLAEEIAEKLEFPWQERIKAQLQGGWEEAHPRLKNYFHKLREYTDLEDTLPSDLKIRLKKELDQLSEKLSKEFGNPWETKALNVAGNRVRNEFIEDIKKIRHFLITSFKNFLEKKKKILTGLFRAFSEKPAENHKQERHPPEKPKTEDAAYAVLGVTPDANTREIRKAYHRLIRIYHPDQWTGTPEYTRAQERTVMINRAKDDLVLLRKKNRKSSKVA